MAIDFQRWRQRNHLTQVDAAALLGVSQPYVSLLEKGTRPVTRELRNRLTTVKGDARQHGKRNANLDDRFRAQLSALGYPGFAHVAPARAKPRADAFLLSVLSQPEIDARVVEALPWVVRRYADQLDLQWLVRQAKFRNLQNRLGFLLQVARADSAELLRAVAELDRARLLQEDTFCWESMPAATREWLRKQRAPLAAYWNIVTTLAPEALAHAE